MTDLVFQVRAVLVLLELLTTRNLPPCRWLVFTALGLEGEVTNERPDYDPEYAIAKWAKVLGDPPVKKADGIMVIGGKYHGVSVVISARELGTRPADIQKLSTGPVASEGKMYDTYVIGLQSPDYYG